MAVLRQTRYIRQPFIRLDATFVLLYSFLYTHQIKHHEPFMYYCNHENRLPELGEGKFVQPIHQCVCELQKEVLLILTSV